MTDYSKLDWSRCKLPEFRAEAVSAGLMRGHNGAYIFESRTMVNIAVQLESSPHRWRIERSGSPTEVALIASMCRTVEEFIEAETKRLADPGLAVELPEGCRLDREFIREGTGVWGVRVPQNDLVRDMFRAALAIYDARNPKVGATPTEPEWRDCSLAEARANPEVSEFTTAGSVWFPMREYVTAAHPEWQRFRTRAPKVEPKQPSVRPSKDLRDEQEREKSNRKQVIEPPTEAADVDWHYLGDGWETSTSGLDTLAAAASVLQEIDKCLASLGKCCDYNECEVELRSVTVDGVRWEVRRV